MKTNNETRTGNEANSFMRDKKDKNIYISSNLMNCEELVNVQNSRF